MIDLNRNIDYVILENLNMKEYPINDFLTLKLEDGKTFVYVKGKRFIQCKRLVLNISRQELSKYDEIDSIDEAVEEYKHTIWQNRIVEGPMAKPSPIQDATLTPEQEFWGHCSNLQTWYEHNYDTRLLHSNLAFPLLKALVDAGETKAKAILKMEIVERFESGHPNVIKSILSAKLLDYLTPEETSALIQDTNLQKIAEDDPKSFFDFYNKGILDYLIPEEKRQLLYQNYPLLFKKLMEVGIEQNKNNLIIGSYVENLFKDRLLDYLNSEEKKDLLQQNTSVIFNYIEVVSKHCPNLFLYIFKEKLFDYLNPFDLNYLSNSFDLRNYPLILTFIEKKSKLYPKTIQYLFDKLLGQVELKQIITKNLVSIKIDIDKIWKHHPYLFLYYFEEKLLKYFKKEEKEKLVEQNHSIIFKYLQKTSQDILFYCYNARILNYLHPKEKIKLLRWNSHSIIIKLKSYLRFLEITGDVFGIKEEYVINIFKDSIFDYLNLIEKQFFIQEHFPSVLIYIEKISEGFIDNEFSEEALSEMYVIVINSIKGTKLVDQFFSAIAERFYFSHKLFLFLFTLYSKTSEFLVDRFRVAWMELVTLKGRKETPEEIRERREKEVQEKKRRKKEKRKKKISRKSTETARMFLSVITCERCEGQLSLKSMLILLEKGQVYCPNCGRIIKQRFNIKEKTAQLQEIETYLSKAKPLRDRFINARRFRCPMCGAEERDIEEIEKKSKILYIPIYRKKYVCNSCGYEFK